MNKYPYIPRDGLPLVKKILEELKKAATILEKKRAKKGK